MNINECDANLCEATCENSIGSFKSSSNNRRSGNRLTCTAHNECEKVSNDCTKFALILHSVSKLTIVSLVTVNLDTSVTV